MKVFISWSGERSKEFAETLREWLPTIIQSLEPFMSSQDIPPGGRGLNVLAAELQECSFGILCLTQDNKQQPWINFEAGALSKVIDVGNVVPLLLDLNPNDITGPLTQFQAINASSREEILRLVKALAELSNPPRPTEQVLERTFGNFWPELEAKISALQKTGQSHQGQEIRSDREILEEILTLSRRADRELVSVAQAFEPSGDDFGSESRGNRLHLNALSMAELQRLAQRMGLAGTARMRKGELLQVILDAQSGRGQM